jgi:hypothetical protein
MGAGNDVVAYQPHDTLADRFGMLDDVVAWLITPGTSTLPAGSCASAIDTPPRRPRIRPSTNPRRVEGDHAKGV